MFYNNGRIKKLRILCGTDKTVKPEIFFINLDFDECLKSYRAVSSICTMNRILDTNNEKTDLNKVMDKQCQHLTATERYRPLDLFKIRRSVRRYIRYMQYQSIRFLIKGQRKAFVLTTLYITKITQSDVQTGSQNNRGLRGDRRSK